MSLGCEVTLDVLKYAGDEKKDFSFHWMKDKEMNIKTKSSLLFNKVKKEHFCHYQCQVKKEGKVVFTTYRALFESKYLAIIIIVPSIKLLRMPFGKLGPKS